MSFYGNNRTGTPELKHPVPTHPAYIPEPPTTPNSPQGYKRFASSPPPAQPLPQSMHTAASPPQAYASPPAGYAQPHPAFTTAQGGNQARGQAPPSFAVPQADFGAWGMNDATAQFGMQLGQSAVSAGQQYMQQNVRRVPASVLPLC